LKSLTGTTLLIQPLLSVSALAESISMQLVRLQAA